MMEPVDEDKPVSLVAKATSVLRALTRQPVMSTAEIAAAIGEPTSSVYRLLDALTRIDWIEPAPVRGRHRLSPRWMGYASAMSRSLDLRKVALPVLEELRRQTGETAFLCVRRGSRAACIERVDGEGVQSLALAIGGSLPLHTGAAPRVLLAAESAAQIDEYFATAAIGAAPSLRSQMDEVARAGYAVSDGDVTPGIAALGAPIRDHSSRVIAAISLSGLRDSLLSEDKGALVALVDKASALSAALGYIGDQR